MAVLDNYPLHLAARDGRLEDLRLLISSNRSEINKGNFELVRPLHIACLSGQYECVQLLIENGAQVDLRNIDGATPLCDACCHGDWRCVQLLLDKGAMVNPPCLLTTPLHEAVMRNNWRCVSMLIEHGASLDVTDCHFGSPLHVAACKGYLECASLLLKAGANPNCFQIHKTALHEAARTQNYELIQLLLEHGANVFSKNNQGFTAKQLVPSSTSPCKALLQMSEDEPLSMKQFCRLKIRKTLGLKRINSIENLGLPKLVVKYLQFE